MALPLLSTHILDNDNDNDNDNNTNNDNNDNDNSNTNSDNNNNDNDNNNNNSDNNDNDNDNDSDDEINPFTSLLLPPTADDGDHISLTPPTDDSCIRRYHVSSLKTDVVIRQLPSEGLSFQLWPAGDTLFSLIDGGKLNRFLCRGGERRLRVLEIGSGTGLVGIAAAAVLGADVTVTDLGRAVQNLEHNVGENVGVVAAGGGAVVAVEMGWGNVEQMEAVGRGYDVVLGSDVVYHDHLYDLLLETLKFFLLGGGGETVFIMAHLKRWKKEATFFKKARKVFDVDVIHRERPDEGKRVGVMVYCFTAKKPLSKKVSLGNEVLV